MAPVPFPERKQTRRSRLPQKRKKRNMLPCKRFYNIFAKPKGCLGRLLLRGLNARHAGMGDWGIAHLDVEPPREILDIGSGGGRHLHALLTRYPGAYGTAVDYAPLAVKMTRRFNRAYVKAGRCVSILGDVSDLTLPAGKFDLVTAFETIYFWPGLITCFEQVARVVKPGGTFLVVNEADGIASVGRFLEKRVDAMTLYKPSEVEEALRAAGFSEVTSVHHSRRPWFAAIAKK